MYARISLSPAKKITVILILTLTLVPTFFWLAGKHFDVLNFNNASLGERIYTQGIDSTGEPLQGETEGDIEFKDANFNCAQCHRRSGYGSSEGGNYVLPVTGDSLFNPRNFDRTDLFKKLFKESQSPLFWARMRSSYQRPAYTEETLALAIREGIDPSGRKLAPLMPRYQLNDRDMAGLIAYLKNLSIHNDPGVDDKAIYLATVVSKGVDADRKHAMLSTIAKFVDWSNMETKGNQAHPNFSPNYRSDFAKAFRTWSHEIWELSDNPEDWPKELAAYYAKKPVFALIGGMVDGDWAPIHEFCETNSVPCLFPLTDLPSDHMPSHYSVYFNEGLALEAKVIAKYLLKEQDAEDPIVLFYIQGHPESEAPAMAFIKALNAGRSHKLETVVVKSPQTLQEDWATYFRNHPHAGSVVIWPGKFEAAILSMLTIPSAPVERIFLPSTVLESDLNVISKDMGQKLYFAYPYELPGAQQPHAFRVRAWMNTRALPINNPRIQFNTYYALSLLQASLEHVIDHFSRDYLLEYIEHEAENALNPGIFPRLSLGPEQRFASKGAYLVKLDQTGKQLIEPASAWTVP